MRNERQSKRCVAVYFIGADFVCFYVGDEKLSVTKECSVALLRPHGDINKIEEKRFRFIVHIDGKEYHEFVDIIATNEDTALCLLPEHDRLKGQKYNLTGKIILPMVLQ